MLQDRVSAIVPVILHRQPQKTQTFIKEMNTFPLRFIVLLINNELPIFCPVAALRDHTPGKVRRAFALFHDFEATLVVGHVVSPTR